MYVYTQYQCHYFTVLYNNNSLEIRKIFSDYFRLLQCFFFLQIINFSLMSNILISQYTVCVIIAESRLYLCFCLSVRKKFLKLAVQLACLRGSMLIGLYAHSHSTSRSNDWDVQLTAAKWSIDQSAEPVGRWDALQQTVKTWQVMGPNTMLHSV